MIALKPISAAITADHNKAGESIFKFAVSCFFVFPCKKVFSIWYQRRGTLMLSCFQCNREKKLYICVAIYCHAYVLERNCSLFLLNSLMVH